MLPQRKLIRLKGFDYSSDRYYFVTIRVQDMRCCLGHISGGQMCLNEYGQIAERQWLWLATQYAYVVLHEFVIMPNHIHGIIKIDSSKKNEPMKIKSLSELMGAYKTKPHRPSLFIGRVFLTLLGKGRSMTISSEIWQTMGALLNISQPIPSVGEKIGPMKFEPGRIPHRRLKQP